MVTVITSMLKASIYCVLDTVLSTTRISDSTLTYILCGNFKITFRIRGLVPAVTVAVYADWKHEHMFF